MRINIIHIIKEHRERKRIEKKIAKNAADILIIEMLPLMKAWHNYHKAIKKYKSKAKVVNEQTSPNS